MTDRALVLAALVALHESQCGLARRLHVNPRTVRRWLAGTVGIKSLAMRETVRALGTPPHPEAP